MCLACPSSAYIPCSLQLIVATCSSLFLVTCWVQLREDLVPCLAAVRNAAKRVTRVAAECKMPDVVRLCCAVLCCAVLCSDALDHLP